MVLGKILRDAELLDRSDSMFQFMADHYRNQVRALANYLEINPPRVDRHKYHRGNLADASPQNCVWCGLAENAECHTDLEQI